MKELKPGIHEGISYRDYHALPYVSNSLLSRLDRCPANVLVEETETPTLVFGRAVHCFILEGLEQFGREFAVAPVCDRRTKDGKAAWAEFQGKNLDKQIMDKKDFDAICGMCHAVFAHPAISIMLKAGISEVTVIWDDPKTGIRCKARPDRIPDGNRGVLLDLKSTRDASKYSFGNSIRSFGYYRQVAFYIAGINEAMKQSGQGGTMEFDGFVFIAVEREAPYRVEGYMLDPLYIERGAVECQQLLQLYKECREKRFFPNYVNAGIEEIFMPLYL